MGIQLLQPRDSLCIRFSSFLGLHVFCVHTAHLSCTFCSGCRCCFLMSEVAAREKRKEIEYSDVQQHHADSGSQLNSQTTILLGMQKTTS